MIWNMKDAHKNPGKCCTAQTLLSGLPGEMISSRLINRGWPFYRGKKQDKNPHTLITGRLIEVADK